MQIEGVPEGYELVRIGMPNVGELFLHRSGDVLACDGIWFDKNYVIVRKIERPKRYRPFANGEEFKPHRDRWIRRSWVNSMALVGAYRVQAYDDIGVWFADRMDTYETMFSELRVFDDDGTPFGIEVTE